MSSQFWINDPSVILNKEYIFNIWPQNKMCFEEKLNSITRLVIILTFLGFLITMNVKFIITGIITIIITALLYFYKIDKINKDTMNEGFGVMGKQIIDKNNLDDFLKEEFKEGNSKNPFSNVLLTEITDDPYRNSSPPSFNPTVDEDIMKNTKKMVQDLNPGIKNTNEQLFGSLIDNFDLEQSMRPFYSTPNTKIANDMNAFAEWLYHDLKYSAKESTPEGAIARTADSYRYTLY
jgi:hypothetical protein